MSGRRKISVGVIGGGVGGLASALHLLHSDFDVHVYERAGALSDVGAGIQVSPNASRVLHRLGLAGDLARMGVRPVAFHQRRWDDGRTLLRAPLGDAVVEAFGFPHYQTHRADLLATLAGTLPAERVHLAHRLVAFADHGDRVDVMFENGATAAVEVLVGADGIHSTVRGLMFGAEPHDSPVASRIAAWCRRNVCRISSSRSRRRCGWGRAVISFTTSSATSGS